MRYLEHRSLVPGGDRKVWGIFGDGEMDEPESIAALTLAAREKLDNLVFVVNCNLQRLDGPVRGNGQHHPRARGRLSAGVGWNVIKVIWGSEWDAAAAPRTHDGPPGPPHGRGRWTASTRSTPSQRRRLHPGALLGRQNPELAEAHGRPHGRTTSHLAACACGGHDMPTRSTPPTTGRRRAPGRQPTVILARTIKKGYGHGFEAGEGQA
ncbi:hypothetical protein [Achromobacter marplatensis]|uniref:hypothetical protein n=1 Tax=Achromobacter marplatensis TaxID=470868 RepID=UPI003C76D597